MVHKETVWALPEAHARLVRQFKAIPVPTYTYRWDGERFVLIAYNDASFKLTGGAVAGYLGKTADEINPTRPDLQQNLADCLREQTTLEKEVVFDLNGDGMVHTITAHYAFAPPDMVVVHVVDVTEQRRTEAALRAANERLTRLVDASPLSIMVFDRQAKLTLWNQAAERLFGWAADEVLGKQTPTVPLDMAQDHARRYAEIVAGQPRTYEGPRRRKDGAEVYVRSSAAPLLDSNGEVEGVIVVTADITAEHRAAVAKDEFVATLSHELRTPLNAILGWTRMLTLGTMTDPVKHRRALTVIQQNAERQAQLIEDLLDISRILKGNLRLDVVPIPRLADVVAAAAETVGPSAAARQIDIRLALAADAGPVLGDPGRLQQVVWNLLSNAVKFTPAGGTVRVALVLADGRAVLTVSDTGVGISRDFLPHVFERFRQGDSSSTRAVSGLGLGLAIARDVLHLHGGTIEVASEGPGCGATFTVSLPLMGAEPGDGTADRRQMDATALAGTTIVVVDDEADSREVIAEMLRQAGASVHTCASAEEALAALRRTPVSVLLTDIAMPGTDGLALFELVRAETAPAPPAIAVTGYAFPDDRARLLSRGFAAHLVKPIDPAELVATVQSALRP